MKKNTHPEYRKVLYKDSSNGTRFLCNSTQKTTKTEVFEGVEYPLYEIPVSAYSHPYFTGENKLVDSEGRVDKFNKRYANKNAVLRAKVDTEDAPAATSKKSAKK